MKELQNKQNQEELDGIINQKKRLVEAYKTQLIHLKEREKELNNALKSI